MISVVIIIPNAYAVSFRDHTGYIPSWAESIGQNQALAVCSNVEYDTPDWNWCQEFSGYVVDTFDSTSEDDETSSQTSSTKGKIFEKQIGDVTINSYRNNIYGFSIISPKNWSVEENKELLSGEGSVLVAFYSDKYNKDYTANFGISYRNPGKSFYDLLSLYSEQEFLDALSGRMIDDTSQTKVVNKSLETFTDGYKITVEFIQTVKVDKKFIPLQQESVMYILDTGDLYLLTFTSTPDDFVQSVDEFRKSADTFYVGEVQTISGITGKYTNSEVGFKMDIPDGWFGHETSIGILILPTNEKFTDNPELTMVIRIEDKSTLEANIRRYTSTEESSERQDNGCKDFPILYFLLNKIPARESTVECNDNKIKTYYVATKDDKVISIMYVANFPLNEKKIADFEKFAGTLQVDSPTSIKDFWRQAAGFKTSEQMVSFDNYSTKLRMDSFSPISDFVFDAHEKKISFKVNESTGDGSTLISISKILEGPYTVMMDGNVADYDMTEDKIDKVMEIAVDYKQGIHNISITGEKLVPQTIQQPIPQKTLDKQPVETKSPSNSKSGCLIATASFGSELAPQVQQLRELRDNALLKTSSGSAFMTAFNSVYYAFSPTVAEWEMENSIFKEMVKATITPLITTLSILNYVDIDSEAEMLGYGIGIILLNVGMYFVAPAFVIMKLGKHYDFSR